MTHHHLHSSPETCHWGFFEAALKPVLTIASGDEVTVDTISGGPDMMPDRSKFHIPPEMHEVHAKNERMLPGHILTGPIAVEGAEPGDVLAVEILDVQLRQDWGWNMIKPLSGTLPDDFHETRILNIPLDRSRMVARMPWGLDLPLKPFFGVMGVSPPPAWGRISSLVPRAMGGNLDNKELGAGATLYLPVFVPGALFSCGDGHGVQGDGEVCVTAIETALQGRFRLTLRKDLRRRLSAWRDGDALHDHGDGPRSGPVRGAGAARHDRAARREAQFVARGRLYAVQPGGRSAGDPDRQRLKRHPLHDRQVDRARLSRPAHS
ncbi:acetamidase/formamidase [Bradyrhizobium sp. GM7.3]